jgi:hypothetical protein
LLIGGKTPSGKLPGKKINLPRSVVILNILSERHFRFFAQSKVKGSCCKLARLVKKPRYRSGDILQVNILHQGTELLPRGKVHLSKISSERDPPTILGVSLS